MTDLSQVMRLIFKEKEKKWEIKYIFFSERKRLVYNFYLE